MSYVFTCNCGEEHLIETSQAGQKIECKCGASLQAPSLREMRSLPQVETSAQPVDKGERWSQMQGQVTPTIRIGFNSEVLS
jgi:hypothetical protein